MLSGVRAGGACFAAPTFVTSMARSAPLEPDPMTAHLDLRRAHSSHIHGDIAVVFTYVNDERAMVLIPHLRKGAPWFIVCESAAYTWDDSDKGNVSGVVRKCAKACEVLGIEPSAWNCQRIARLVIGYLPELIRMPSAPVREQHSASFGTMEIRADGKTIAGQEIRLEREDGATYG